MLPAAASFKRQGANRGAVSAFLVTTPESGVDSIAISYALLDPILTVMRPLAAFVTGVSAGLLENSLENPDRRTPAPLRFVPLAIQPQDTAPSKDRRLAVGLRYAFIDVWGDIVVWFSFGLFLAGVVTAYLPEDFSELVLGGGLVSMLTMLAVGMPVYICATASTPVAAALLLKGASPGAVLVFLLAGPATNLTSLSVLIQVLGKWGTLRYLLVVATVSILFGLGVDQLYRVLGIEARAVIAEVREIVPYWLKIGSAVFLLLLSGYHVLRWLGRPRHGSADQSCGHGDAVLVPFPADGQRDKEKSGRNTGSRRS